MNINVFIGNPKAGYCHHWALHKQTLLLYVMLSLETIGKSIIIATQSDITMKYSIYNVVLRK